MRKLSLILILLISMSLPVQARTANELGGLAAYYGADTLVYGATRTDVGFVETLDGLVGRMAPFIPGGLPPGINVSFLLDNLAFELAATNVDSLRSWLGDSAAVGFYLNETVVSQNDAPLYITLSVTDSEAAVDFFTDLLTASGDIALYEITEDGGFTFFEAIGFADSEFAIGPDVMFIAENLDIVPVFGVQASLADQSSFQSSLSLLPAESYNVILYLDSSSLQSMISSMAMDDDAMPSLPPELMSLNTIQVMGLTVLNGDSLVWDIAATLPDPADQAALGISYPVLEPLNFDLSSRIPADAILVTQGSNFGESIQVFLDNIRDVGDYIAANGGIVPLLGVPLDGISDEELAFLELFNPAQIIPFINISFSGLTGLSLERDVLPVLSGDTASFVRLLPDTTGLGLGIMPDLGVYFQTSDEAAAISFVEQLQRASEAYNAGYSISAYGDGAALAMPILGNAIGQSMPATDLLFGASGDIFALGTRGAVEAALVNDAGLDRNASFIAAQALFLDGSQQMLYIDLAPLNVLLDDLEVLPPRDQRELRILLSLLESASISAVQTDTAAISRLVLTLADAPIELPDPASGS